MDETQVQITDSYIENSLRELSSMDRQILSRKHSNPFERAIASINWLRARADKAERALRGAGFTLVEGAEFWKPPVNEDAYAPKFFDMERRAESAEAERDRLRKTLDLVEGIVAKGGVGLLSSCTCDFCKIHRIIADAPAPPPSNSPQSVAGESAGEGEVGHG